MTNILQFKKPLKLVHKTIEETIDFKTDELMKIISIHLKDYVDHIDDSMVKQMILVKNSLQSVLYQYHNLEHPMQQLMKD